MEKVSAVYKISNTVTGDFYIGSSKNVKQRWAAHKCSSTWKKCPNNPMYSDFKKYGIDKFIFQILAEAEPEQLKEAEQEFIEKLQPTYNNYNASGLDVERRKKYEKTDKCKESKRKSQRKYHNQICLFNGETITLHALSERFKRKGINHPTAEAKKYLIKN